MKTFRRMVWVVVGAAGLSVGGSNSQAEELATGVPKTAENEAVQAREPWRTDFKVFLENVADTVSNAKRPTDSQLLNGIRSRIVLNDKEGRPLLVISTDRFEDEIHGALAKRFTGKVQWNGKVVEVTNNVEKATTKITLAWPDAKRFLDFFSITSKGCWTITLPTADLRSGLPEVGNIFAFSGELLSPEELNGNTVHKQGVFVWYGVGEESGKNFFILNVSNIVPK